MIAFNMKTKTHQQPITTAKEYNASMKEIDGLMKQGEANLNQAQLKKIRSMAEAAEEYEDKYYPLPMPSTLMEMIELKMFQLKLNQEKMAKILEVGTPKLSQILNGKREPDVAFLKAAYKKLNIDPAFLLEKV